MMFAKGLKNEVSTLVCERQVHALEDRRGPRPALDPLTDKAASESQLGDVDARPDIR
jgi:hypothetical protein